MLEICHFLLSHMCRTHPSSSTYVAEIKCPEICLSDGEAEVGHLFCSSSSLASHPVHPTPKSSQTTGAKRSSIFQSVPPLLSSFVIISKCYAKY